MHQIRSQKFITVYVRWIA